MLKLIAPPLLFSLTACTSGQGSTEIPGYAIMVEYDLFHVTCGNVRSAARGRVADIFYTEEGVMKSREEFCAENSVGTGVRR